MKLASRRTVVSLKKSGTRKTTDLVQVLTHKYIEPNSFGSVVPVLQIKRPSSYVPCEVVVKGVMGSVVTLKNGEYVFIQ